MSATRTWRLDGIAARLLALAVILAALLAVAATSTRLADARDDGGSTTPSLLATEGDPEVATDLQVANLALGDQVVVTGDDLSHRAGPGLAAAVVAVLPAGTQGSVTAGPIVADGYTWYGFSAAGYGNGWVAGEFLALAGAGSAFPSNAAAVVAAEFLTLRSGPGVGNAAVGILPLGTLVTILDGPIVADGYSWYQLRSGEQVAPAWAAGEFLADPPTDIQFIPSAAVVVTTDGLNLRSGPGVDAPVIAILGLGTQAVVASGPIAAGDYNWYKIATSNSSQVGWVVGAYLAAR